MTYKKCLKPWAVARLLPTGKWVIIGRYSDISPVNSTSVTGASKLHNLDFLVVPLRDCATCLG